MILPYNKSNQTRQNTLGNRNVRGLDVIFGAYQNTMQKNKMGSRSKSSSTNLPNASSLLKNNTPSASEMDSVVYGNRGKDSENLPNMKIINFFGKGRSKSTKSFEVKSSGQNSTRNIPRLLQENTDGSFAGGYGGAIDPLQTKSTKHHSSQANNPGHYLFDKALYSKTIDFKKKQQMSYMAALGGFSDRKIGQNTIYNLKTDNLISFRKNDRRFSETVRVTSELNDHYQNNNKNLLKNKPHFQIKITPFSQTKQANEKITRNAEAVKINGKVTIPNNSRNLSLSLANLDDIDEKYAIV